MAGNVTPERASTVAQHFLRQQVEQQKLPAELGELYLFKANHGFAIVPSDDRVRPILAYSFTTGFATDVPSNVKAWLEGYCNEIKLLRSRGIEASAWVSAEWQALYESEQQNPLYSVVVDTLITTKWNQLPYYNDLCPLNTSENERTVTGCVATATAQIMKYWSHPEQGTGSHSYSDPNYGSQSANFGATTYNWSLMPKTLNSSSTTAQINAVATLMYHVGVAIEMSYGTINEGGSGAHNHSDHPADAAAENALRTYFGYSYGSYPAFRAAMSDAEWCTIIETELARRHPVLYDGRDASGGHSFVCDGCNASGQLHFNWGWGGYCDGYYTSGALNPSAGGAGGSYTSTYNIRNTAVLGIQPAPATHPANTTLTVNTTDAANSSVSGGGTYNYGDTVTLFASTEAGYRFARWSDGNSYDPRYVLVDSARTYTAVVEPAKKGNEFYYATGEHLGSHYFDYYALKLESTDLTDFSTLDTVRYYDGAASGTNLTLFIYKGGASAPATMIHSQTVVAGGTNQYANIALTSPVVIDATQPLWIIIQDLVSDYPVPVTMYGGNRNGSWFSTDGSNWNYFNSTYSWMLKAVFTSTYNLTANVPDGHGVVYGAGEYKLGDTAVLRCFAYDLYRFAGWTDGDSSNPRYVIVDGPNDFSAIFEPIGTDTVAYTWSNAVGTFGSNNGNSSWGIVLPHDAISGGEKIKAVQFYAKAGTYTVKLYSMVDTSLIHSQSITVSGDASWRTVNFLIPQTVPSSGGLLVSVQCSTATGVYPIYVSAFSGLYGSFMFSSNGGANWIDLTASYGYMYTCMIRAIFTMRPTHTVSVTATDGGSVEGAGTYHEGQTATLLANANDGYRFVFWSDSILNNPRGFVVASDTVATPVFAPVEGDTLHYYGYRWLTNFGSGSNEEFTWGVKFVPSSFASHPKMKAVEFFLNNNAEVDLNVYQGESPDNWHLVHTQQSSMTADTVNFQTLTIESQPVLSTSEPLWIVLHATGTAYPAAATVYAGTPNSAYYFINGTEINSLPEGNMYYSWMIRAIMDTLPTYAVTATTDAGGTVHGQGRYTVGTTATLTAEANTCYTFGQWGDGSTENPRTVVVNGDVNLEAHFVPITLQGSETVSTADSYTWFDSVYSVSGTYTHLTTSVEGCDSIATLILTITNAVNEVDGIDAVKAYPTPTKGIVFINAEVQSVEVYNEQGALLQTVAEPRVDLTDYPSGTYMLRIRTAEGTAARRIIKL
ncbi:MAG: C10 family peptidase [Bacteroidales bacterium]|nr:C10 family peptidase [Bacteroidales bacterium]